MKDAKSDNMIWAELLQLGSNMWWDAPQDPANVDPAHRFRYAVDRLQWDRRVWREWTEKMASAGLNMAVIDIGEGMIYPSCPELAVKGSWTPEMMRAEIARLAALGIEAVPKLNFSTCHDAWLGEYHRMVSTPDYYRVCAGIIRDVCEIFGTPRFLHIGFDEEDVNVMKTHCYASARQGELWWHDLLWFVSTVESCGVRAWMWSDASWRRPDEFVRRCPKTVLQSNWCYGDNWNPAEGTYWHPIVKAFETLDRAGFEQIPCGTNWCWERKDVKGLDDRRFSNLVRHCRKSIAPERLRGFLMAPWWGRTDDGAFCGAGAVERNRSFFLESIELAGRAKRDFSSAVRAER